jgi:hypothetical protein
VKYVLGLMLVVFPLCGAVLIVAGIQGLWTTWRRRPFLRSALGTIVAVERRPAPGRTETYWKGPYIAYQPIVRFTTESGEVREFRSPAGKIGRSPMYRIGATLPVLYDPDEVLPPTIDSWFALWGGHLTCILVGPIFFGGAALVYVEVGRRLLGGA